MRKLLRLDENRILVEQLRLLMGNVRSTVIPSLLISLALLWTLSNDRNAWGMGLWATATICLKLYCAHHARHYLHAGIAPAQAPRLAWVLMGWNALYGATWGALAWVTLDTTTLVQSIFVLAVLAGIVGGSMAGLSPVLPVFVVFVVCETAALASKAWLMDDPTYRTLTIASLIFVASLILQARNSAIATRSAINLRFENIELAARLRAETDKAQAAHQQAVQANLAKSKFLAAASHDLRQPIHALGLFLEVLARSELTEIQRNVLGNARAVSGASAEMLDTLLDFSRIEAGMVDA